MPRNPPKNSRATADLPSGNCVISAVFRTPRMALANYQDTEKRTVRNGCAEYRNCPDRPELMQICSRGSSPGYEPVVLPMVSLTEENVLLELVPRAVMAAMHTTTISASITAYSTAVGPSSRFRKFTTPRQSLENMFCLFHLA